VSGLLVGVDLGKEGALVTLQALPQDCVLLHSFRMPMLGKDYNLLGIISLLELTKPSLVVVERAQQFKGRGNSTPVARAQGLFEGICAARGWPIALVAATSWQSKMLAGTQREVITRMAKNKKTGALYKVERSNTKERVQKAIQMRWPTLLHALRTEGERDAFLIAQYGVIYLNNPAALPELAPQCNSQSPNLFP
jgi:hypothetical protein